MLNYKSSISGVLNMMDVKKRFFLRSVNYKLQFLCIIARSIVEKVSVVDPSPCWSNFFVSYLNNKKTEI